MILLAASAAASSSGNSGSRKTTWEDGQARFVFVGRGGRPRRPVAAHLGLPYPHARQEYGHFAPSAKIRSIISAPEVTTGRSSWR